jgi:hypothetical protein
VYNEAVFASLDWVLDQAAQRNLKLIIPIEVGTPDVLVMPCIPAEALSACQSRCAGEELT